MQIFEQIAALKGWMSCLVWHHNIHFLGSQNVGSWMYAEPWNEGNIIGGGSFLLRLTAPGGVNVLLLYSLATKDVDTDTDRTWRHLVVVSFCCRISLTSTCGYLNITPYFVLRYLPIQLFSPVFFCKCSYNTKFCFSCCLSFIVWIEERRIWKHAVQPWIHCAVLCRVWAKLLKKVQSKKKSVHPRDMALMRP